ncbi:m29 protein [Murid betaherpesvirus 1]|nr:m29 protein [Murid betaherpesvirus 1]
MWSSPKRRPLFLLTKAFTSSKELTLHALAQRNSSPLAWKLSTPVARPPDSKSTRCAVPVTMFMGTTGILEAMEVGATALGSITIAEKAATGGIGGVGGVGAGSTGTSLGATAVVVSPASASAGDSPCSSSRKNTSSRSSSLMTLIPTVSRLMSTDFYLGSAEKIREIEVHNEKKLLPKWLYAIARYRNAHKAYYDRTTNLPSWQIMRPPRSQTVVGLAPPLLLPHFLNAGISPARFSDRDGRWLSSLTDRNAHRDQRGCGGSGNDSGGDRTTGGGCGGCVGGAGGCGGSRRRGSSDGGDGYTRNALALSFALGFSLGAVSLAGTIEHLIHKEVHPLDIIEGSDELVTVRPTTGECVAAVAIAFVVAITFLIVTGR